MDNKLLEAALHYASKGLPVFPVQPKGKKPLTPNGFKDASIVSRTIHDWWTAYPNANIGLPTGSSGIVVLDVDGPEGEASLFELEQKNCDLPITRSSRTGRGKHLYFKTPSQKFGNSASQIGNMLDIRAHGGYIIAPPSVHPSGCKYLWKDNADMPFAEMPEWLVNVCLEKATTTSAFVPQLSCADISEGGRNDTLTRLCGALLARKLDPELCLDLCQGFNLLKCKPPLTQTEVFDVVDSIAKAELEKLKGKS